MIGLSRLLPFPSILISTIAILRIEMIIKRYFDVVKFNSWFKNQENQFYLVYKKANKEHVTIFTQEIIPNLNFVDARPKDNSKFLNLFTYPEIPILVRDTHKTYRKKGFPRLIYFMNQCTHYIGYEREFNQLVLEENDVDSFVNMINHQIEEIREMNSRRSRNKKN